MGHGCCETKPFSVPISDVYKLKIPSMFGLGPCLGGAGAGAASEQRQCHIQFVPTGTIMALHYRSFINRLTNCPVIIACGNSGTGKTFSIHCALGPMAPGFSTTLARQKRSSCVPHSHGVR